MKKVENFIIQRLGNVAKLRINKLLLNRTIHTPMYNKHPFYIKKRFQMNIDK